MKALLTGLAPALLVGVTLGVAFAKLPPTAPTDPAKAEAIEAKDAATAATTAAQEAKAEDKVVAHYIQSQKAKGKAVTPQMPPNAAEMDAKAREAASKVPGAAPAAPHSSMAQAEPAKPAAAKK
jgi:hypothetical protein